MLLLWIRMSNSKIIRITVNLMDKAGSVNKPNHQLPDVLTCTTPTPITCWSSLHCCHGFCWQWLKWHLQTFQIFPSCSRWSLTNQCPSYRGDNVVRWIRESCREICWSVFRSKKYGHLSYKFDCKSGLWGGGGDSVKKNNKMWWADHTERHWTFWSENPKSLVCVCVDQSATTICGWSGEMRDEPIKLMSVCAPILLNVAERWNSQHVHGCEVKRTQGTISWCVFFTTSYSVNNVTCCIKRDVSENHCGHSYLTFKLIKPITLVGTKKPIPL